MAATDALSMLRAINDTAAFNRWCGFEVQRAAVAQRQCFHEAQLARTRYGGLMGAQVAAHPPKGDSRQPKHQGRAPDQPRQHHPE